MPHIILPKKDIMLSFNKELVEICKPLQTLKITFFNYLKIYKDGSRFDLNNSPEITDYYYYNSRDYEAQAVEWNPFTIKENLLLWSDFEDVAWQIMRDTFNTTHGITIVEKHEETCELFHFASTRSNHKIINFYLNNLDLLKLFIIYFKDKADHIIKAAENNKIKIVNYKKRTTDSEINREEKEALDRNKKLFIQQLNIKKYHPFEHNNQIYLTKKEMECIKWSLKGKTAEEIGLILVY